MVHWLCFMSGTGRQVPLSFSKQTAYIDQVCDRFGASTTRSLPASSTVKLMTRQFHKPRGDERFRELIGPLLWIANQTRPDLVNTVRALARHSHDPSRTHGKIGLQVLANLKGTEDLGLIYERGERLELLGYANSSFAGKCTDW
ncbi:unnamed protein product [Discosporangium mesarthrocarpum]